MNKDVFAVLKQKILMGLEHVSKTSYRYKNNNFEIFLNAYILLSVKLNHTLISDYGAILKSIPHQIDQPNVVNIINGLSQLGYTAQRSRGCKNLHKINYPCLLIKGAMIDKDSRVLFRENDTIISYNPQDNSYSTFDPISLDRGYCIYHFEEFNEERFDLGKGVLKFLGRSWFYALISRFKFVITRLIFISIVLHLFSLVLPLYIIYVYNSVVVSHDKSNLLLITLCVVFLLCCEQLLRFLRARVLSWLGGRVDYIVTNEVLSKLNSLPLTIIENLSLPSQIARIRSFSSVRDFFTGPIFSTLLELPAIFLMILLISYLHYAFTIIFAVGFILIALCLVIFHRILSGKLKKTTMLNTEKYYLTSIFLDKLNTLHYQGLERYYVNKLNYLSEQTAYFDFHSENLSGFVDNFGKLVSNLGILITLWAGIYLIWHNEISVGILLAIVFLSWRVFTPIQVASSTLMRSEKLYRTIKQIDNFLDLPDEYDVKNTVVKSIDIKHSIRLSNIGVFYTSNKNFILRNFSLDVRLGQFVAITGESGSGKSTILKLITGFIKANIGKVLIDQHDMNQLNIQSIRNQMCYIHQSEHLIQGTIYDNIQIVNPFLTHKEIQELFEKLYLLDELNSLSNGLNTYISSDGISYISKKILKYISLAKLYASKASIKLIDGINKESFNTLTWNKFVNDLQAWKGTNTIVMVSDDESILNIVDHKVTLKCHNSLRVKT